MSIRKSDENKIILLLFTSLITIGICSQFRYRIVEEKLLKYKSKSSTYLAVIFWLGIILLLSNRLVLSLLNRENMAEAVMNLRNGSSIKFFIIASSEFIIYFTMIYTGKIRLNFYNIWLFVIVALIIASIGARSLLVSLAISLMVTMYYLRRYSIRWMTIIGLFGIGAFLITSFTRANNTDIARYLQNNLELYTNTVKVVHRINDGEVGYQYGGTLIDALYMPIPTSIWKDKPRSYAPSRLIYPEMISRGVREGTRFTVNFGLIGRGYLEGGIIGVILSSLLYSLIFNRIYYSIFHRSFTGKLKLAFSIFLYGHIFQVLILGITSHIYTMYLISFGFMLIIHLMSNYFQTWRRS